MSRNAPDRPEKSREELVDFMVERLEIDDICIVSDGARVTDFMEYYKKIKQIEGDEIAFHALILMYQGYNGRLS